MTQVYNLNPHRKILFRNYKPLSKPLSNIKNVTPSSPPKQLHEMSNLRRSYSSTKTTNKKIPNTFKSEYNLCSSKNVFVFARKQSFVNPTYFIRTTENYLRREMTEQVFCLNPRAQQTYYRSMVKSSNTRRQKTGSQSQRKRPNSQHFNKTVRINPEPWQMKGQIYDLESLF